MIAIAPVASCSCGLPESHALSGEIARPPISLQDDEQRCHLCGLRGHRHAKQCAWRQQCEQENVPLHARSWQTSLGPIDPYEEGALVDVPFAFGCAFYLRLLCVCTYVSDKNRMLSPPAAVLDGGHSTNFTIEARAKTDFRAPALEPFAIVPYASHDRYRFGPSFGPAHALTLRFQIRAACRVTGALFGWVVL